MIRRTPRTALLLLGATAVVAALAIGFFVGRASDGEDPIGAGSGVAEANPPCTRKGAEKAVLSSRLAATVRGVTEAQAHLNGYGASQTQFFTEDPIDYHVALLRCSDVTGDGVKEMIVGLGAGAAGRIFSWAVFTPNPDGGWRLLFDREGSRVQSIAVRRGAIFVRTPTFGADDALCCPSGYKTTRIEFVNRASPTVVPQASRAEREIIVADGRVLGLGPIETQIDSPVQAVDKLGAPTSIEHSSDSVCDYAWSDLGLSITFANFGAGYSCGRDGRIASFVLFGAPAAQAGWRTSAGARVGVQVQALRELYPGARESGRELVLIETPSPIGGDGTIAVMTAFIGGSRAWAYRFYVGAAGE